MADDADEIGFEPPHPGEYIREDILPALGMTIKDLAHHLGVSRKALSEVIHGHRAVSTQMAIKLGQAFENGARFWLALQMQHSIWHEQRKMTERVPPIEDSAEKAA